MTQHMGSRIRQVRTDLGWTQPELVARVPGLTTQSLSGLETRDSRTSEHAVQIADALGVNLRWLLTGVGQRDDLDWPFPRVDRSRWDACGPEDRGYVQAAINKALDDCDSARVEAARRKPSGTLG